MAGKRPEARSSQRVSLRAESRKEKDGGAGLRLFACGITLFLVGAAGSRPMDRAGCENGDKPGPKWICASKFLEVMVGICNTDKRVVNGHFQRLQKFIRIVQARHFCVHDIVDDVLGDFFQFKAFKS